VGRKTSVDPKSEIVLRALSWRHPSTKEVRKREGDHRRGDPHKSVNAVAAINGDGELLGHEVFPANRAGLRKLERWAKRFSERRWAVDGAASIGRPAAQKLVGSGEEVVDVPPKLSAKVRVLSVGNARKNDRLDATFTALAALRNERLARVTSEDDADGAHVEVLRLLTKRREDLVAERTGALNRLHVLLRDLLSDGPAGASRRTPPPSSCAGSVPITPRDGRGNDWPPSWCAPSTGRSPRWTNASEKRSRHRAPRSRRSSVWGRSSRPRSSGCRRCVDPRAGQYRCNLL
jgi:Transposase